MQFLSIRISSQGKVNDLYFAYGIYRGDLWHCTLYGNNRHIIHTFSHQQINSCFLMLSEYLIDLGKVISVTGLSDDSVFPEVLSNYIFQGQHIDPAPLAMAS